MEWFTVGSEYADIIYHGIGIVGFILFEAKRWEWYQIMIWAIAVISAMEALNRILLLSRPFFKSIPGRGKHLDELETIDILFIWFNRLCTPVFTFHVIQFCWFSPNVAWKGSELSIVNIVISLICMFIMYDLPYTVYHKILHIRGLYKYIHKHHHRQKVPTRGNIDAINVHPIEFVMGEYNHLLVMYLTSKFMEIHVASVLLFLLIGATLASLNHTRFNIIIGPIFQVKYHDIHHWYPSANFGQYSMLWDRIFGWYKMFPDKKVEEKQK